MRLLAALALLALSACGSSRDDGLSVEGLDLTQDPAALIGDWDLVATRTSGMDFPSVTTRAPNLRFSSACMFRPDGTFEWRSDGELIQSGSYEVRRYEFEGSPTEIPYLFLNGSSRWFGITGDRLFFDDRAADGELREYHRR